MAELANAFSMGKQFFDRCIDLKFYSSTGTLLATIETPETGMKPDIVVKGSMLGGGTSIQNEVTITNLEAAVPANEVSVIYAELYYRGLGLTRSTAIDTTYKVGFTLNVLWAEPTAQPPDRQVTFHCTAVSTDGSILGAYVPDSYKKKTTNGKEPQETTLATIMNNIKDAYNDVMKANNKFSKLPEALKPNIKTCKFMPASIAGDTLIAPTGERIGELIQNLILSTRWQTEEDGQPIWHNKYDVFIDETGDLVVQQTPDDEAVASLVSKAEETTAVKLDYVIAAYRNGPVVHIQCLFDPRIRLGTTCKILGSMILGRKVGGKLMPIADDQYLPFSANTRIDYEFGTVRMNSMRIQGILGTGQKGLI